MGMTNICCSRMFFKKILSVKVTPVDVHIRKPLSINLTLKDFLMEPNDELTQAFNEFLIIQPDRCQFKPVFKYV